MMKGNHWPAERTALLLDLYGKGVSLAGIAKAINTAEPGLDITDSSVGKKIKRMGRTPDALPVRPEIEGPWTADAVKKLEAMWGAGKTAAHIATALGFTRSAILGKLRRSNLLGKAPVRVQPAKRSGQFILPRTKHSGGRQAHLEAVVRNSAAKLAPHEGYTGRAGGFEPLPGTNPLPWTERPFNGCAWPVGGEGADTLSCCAPTDGRTYCATHHAMAHTASPPSKRATEKHWVVTPRRRAA